jgi:ADP-heptose:LPS heptosyltransferase
MKKESNKHKKILLFLSGGIGDVLCFTPALEALGKEFSEAQIDAIVRNNGSERVLKYNPYINNILVYKRNNINQKAERINLLRRILGQKYTTSITFCVDFSYKTGLAALLSGASRRIGPKIGHQGIFYNVKVHMPDNKHFIYRNYDLVKNAGVNRPLNLNLRFYLDDQERTFTKNFLQSKHIKSAHKIVGVHPGGGTWRKIRRWPKDKYIKVINCIVKEQGIKVVLMGGPDEKQLVNEILKETSNQVIAANNNLTLGQFAALVGRCDLFLGNDGGPLQIASAMGTPTVGIVGFTDPAVFAPIGSKHVIVRKKLPCSPCIDYYDYNSDACEEQTCMKEINVSQLIDVIKKKVK